MEKNIIQTIPKIAYVLKTPYMNRLHKHVSASRVCRLMMDSV